MRFSAVALVLFTLATSAKSQSWVPIKLNTGGNDLNTVYFIDSKRGWVGGDAGFLSRTEDGGTSWTRQNVGTKAAINDIYFRDKEAGFFLAGNSIFVTRDNGATWNQLKIFSPEEFDGADVELYSVRFANKKKAGSSVRLVSAIAWWTAFLFTRKTAVRRGGASALPADSS